jgi:hypothetical protein
MADGQMLHVISNGQGNMASYTSQVERADRWRAILHVRRLQAAPPATAASDETAGAQQQPDEPEATTVADTPPPHGDGP